MRTRWYKVLRDLLFSKTRTILVVLSIAIGVFAFGTISNARVIILRELHDSFLATNPASAIIRTDRFDDDLVETVRRMPGVGDAAGRRAVAARVSTGPGEWYDLRLYVIPDDGEQRINIVRPISGAWPPAQGDLLIERASLPKTRSQVGDTVLIEMPNGDTRHLRLAGLTHDLSLPPAPIAGQAFGYISWDTLEWLGLPRGYDQLLIIVAERPLDQDHIQRVADEVAGKIEDSGRKVYVTEVPTPQKHPAEDIIPTLLLIFSMLGVLALVLSAFLIINTISAILSQQMRQIGIMKAIGARTGQIVRLYLGMVLAFGLLGLLVSLPLGALGTLALAGFVAGQLNVDITGLSIDPQVLAMMVAASLLVPVATTLQPVLATARTTVKDAINNYGITEGKAKRRDKETRRQGDKGQASMLPVCLSPNLLVSWLLTLISRPVMLSLRNTFRRKGRLMRTLVALTFAGGIFMSVMTLRTSLVTTLEDIVRLKNYDIEVRLSRPYRDAGVEQEALRVDGVTGVESWASATAYPVRPNDVEGENINLYALPATSRMLRPKLVAGRWLLPDDDRAVVVSTNYQIKEPYARLGDTIVLKIDGEEYNWQIVGITQEFVPPISPAIAYVTYDAYVRAMGEAGHTTSLRVATAHHDPAFHAQVARGLNEHFAQAKIQVKLARSISEDKAILYERFNVLTSVLTIMALIIGVVGGLGLMGTMSINVLERTREIGVMRAIGASDRAVRQIVVIEGLLIGLLSWGLGFVLSLPMSRLMCYQIGIGLLNSPLSYDYSLLGVGLWLAAVLVIAALASLIPARNASRLTVREVLAYE